jgi:hypothetical protein
VAQFISCPSCQRLLEVPEDFFASGFTCPACLANVQNSPRELPPAKGRFDYLAEYEAQRDVHRTGVGMILLAVLGGIGLSQTLWCIIPVTAEGDFSAAGITLGLVLFLALLSTGIVFWRTRHNPSARGVGRVIVGTLALAGVVVLLLLAAFIVFFAVCLVQLSRMK